MERKQVTIKTNPKLNKALLISSISLFVISIGLYFSDYQDWIPLPLILGIVLLSIIVSGTGKVKCPNCIWEFDNLHRNNSYVKCPNCYHYFEGESGKLWEIDDSHIAKDYVFEAYLPWEDFSKGVLLPAYGPGSDSIKVGWDSRKLDTDVHWPEGCCVCGQPATRKETISQVYLKSVIGGGILTKEIVVFAEDIPHCDEHIHGVIFSLIGPTGITGPGRGILKFVSYHYYKLYIESNPVKDKSKEMWLEYMAKRQK